MDGEIAWIIGTALSLSVVIGGIIARDRQLTRMIQDGDEKLHDRVNRVREDMVRRTDLDDHLQRVDKSLQTLDANIREQGRETTRRLDQLIASRNLPP